MAFITAKRSDLIVQFAKLFHSSCVWWGKFQQVPRLNWDVCAVSCLREIGKLIHWHMDSFVAEQHQTLFLLSMRLSRTGLKCGGFLIILHSFCSSDVNWNSFWKPQVCCTVSLQSKSLCSMGFQLHFHVQSEADYCLMHRQKIRYLQVAVWLISWLKFVVLK